MMWHMWYLQYMSLRILSFCPGPGKSQKLAVMFEDWCGSEEDWGKSKLVLQMRQVNTVGRKGSRKWMCRHEIVDKYKSEVIADEIISQKMSMDETARASVVRDHPDLANGRAPSILSVWCRVWVWPIGHCLGKLVLGDRSWGPWSREKKQEKVQV